MKQLKVLIVIFLFASSLFGDKVQVEGFVERFYVTVLSRASEEAGLEYWSNGLLNKSEAGADIARGFIFSEEFINRATTNEAFLYVLYRAFFNREPDVAGLKTWSSLLSNGDSRNNILNGFLYSQEFYNLCSEYGISPVDKIVIDSSTRTRFRVKQTGQLYSYDNYGYINEDIKDDGFYKKGISPSYTNNGNDTVTDNVTGLIWQDDFSVVDDNNKKTQKDAIEYCNNLNFAGSTNWRLPKTNELNYIIDINRKPSINNSVFRQDVGERYYWSSTKGTDFYHYDYGLSFSFVDNFSYLAGNTNLYNVRCVQGNYNEFHEFARDDTTNIVTDKSTGIEWQDNSEIQDKKFKWLDAIDYCEGLTLGGKSDWRLPNYNEFFSMIDRTLSGKLPSMFNVQFTSESNPLYVTSTSSLKYNNTTYMGIPFYYSNMTHYNKIDIGYVRCIRGGE